MKSFKGLVFVFCGLFIVITLMSLLMPSKVMTTRSSTIASTPQLIMDQLQDLQNWKNWHPVFKNDKNIRISKNSSGAGAYAEWMKGNKKKHLQIISVSENVVRFLIKMPGENDMENKIELTKFEGSNDIQVEWAALTKLKWYPWDKFSGLFIDKITGQGYASALYDLKSFLEQ